MKDFIKNLLAIKDAFSNSISGLKYLTKERAFSQELALFIVVLLVFIFVDIPNFMKFYVFSSYILILITEALNSAIETVVDRISLERSELSQKAKDIASFAVFIALVHFFIVILFTIVSNYM
ncbi:MAG: diacylglycerol kinase [Holosporales bacterium]|jgi:diacylglycerol kinase (ATP)|nr:diacylglycerol kinase [Holosporales bacterium]